MEPLRMLELQNRFRNWHAIIFDELQLIHHCVVRNEVHKLQHVASCMLFIQGRRDNCKPQSISIKLVMAV